jgi:hypothetical protein
VLLLTLFLLPLLPPVLGAEVASAAALVGCWMAAAMVLVLLSSAS